MNRLERTLAALEAEGRAAFMPFLQIGDPNLAECGRLADALIRAGSDILEFGFPFSDPPADGPVIQAASQRALAAGTTWTHCFEFLAELRCRTDRPFALLLYYNLVLSAGVEHFFARAAEVGIDAVLIADLPIEESAEVVAAAKKHGVAPIFIVSARTSDARLEQVLAVASGYLYVVAQLGVTGTRATLDAALGPTLARLRPKTRLPLFAGFGLSKAEHVRAVIAAGADGAIVGSALVEIIGRHAADPAALLPEFEAVARELAEAAHTAEIPPRAD